MTIKHTIITALLHGFALGGMAQSVTIVTDTVRICTGEQYDGVVFGRDSILVTDTLANGDTLRAVQVVTLPVYLNIRDTTLLRGSWFLGERRFDNVSVNEFGQTYLGCDSNITWVIFFRKDGEPDQNYNYSWKCRSFPTVSIDAPLLIELSAQTETQAIGQRANILRFDALGRSLPFAYDPIISNWTRSANTFRLQLDTILWAAGVHYLVVEVTGQTFFLIHYVL